MAHVWYPLPRVRMEVGASLQIGEHGGETLCGTHLWAALMAVTLARSCERASVETSSFTPKRPHLALATLGITLTELLP